MSEGKLEVNPEEASTNFYWTVGNKEVFNVQTTIRGNPSADEIAEHVASAVFAMKHITEMGGHAKFTGSRNVESVAAPLPQTTPTQAAIETGKAAPAPKVNDASTKEMMEVIATRVEVAPKPDSKCELKFFGDGDKYPRIYATKPVTTWVAMLGWDASSFGQAENFILGPDEQPIRLKIGYTLSDKLNTKGNPYKDIQYIK